MRSSRRILTLVPTALLVIGSLWIGRASALSDQVKELLGHYSEVVTVAHDVYGSEVRYEDLVYSSIQGMLRRLDPHSSFLSPKANSNMRERQQESFFGLGILVGMRNGQLTVISPIEGTPASRMGLRAGDVISTIEGQSTDAMTIDVAVDRLKGPRGTQVTIEITRQGLEQPLEVTITRDEIPQDTVRYEYMIAPGTGYLAISDFNRGTGSEVVEAIERLRADGMMQLLLDLRNNGGGLLDQSVAVSDLFLAVGEEIVQTRGRIEDSIAHYHAERPSLNMPVVVLVNNGTASAAEILAGAIQDHDAGLLVGTTTWGKGLVQTVYSLSHGAGLAVTTSRYHTPSGRVIQRDYGSWFDYATGPGETPAGGSEEQQVFLTDAGREVLGGGGITPDVTVELPELPKLAQYLLSRNAFFDFAVLCQSQGRIIGRDWQPGPEIREEFSRWLVDGGLLSTEEVAYLEEPELREQVSRFLHAELLGVAFGMEARHQAMASGDPQIQTGLELLDEAAELLTQAER